MKTKRKLQSLLLSVCWVMTVVLFAFCATGCEANMQTLEKAILKKYPSEKAEKQKLLKANNAGSGMVQTESQMHEPQKSGVKNRAENTESKRQVPFPEAAEVDTGGKA
jgi:hypothetical protein